jgi:hypothetical protein
VVAARLRAAVSSQAFQTTSLREENLWIITALLHSWINTGTVPILPADGNEAKASS